MSLERVCFYCFLHILVKLGGCVDQDVGCCYTYSELSVKLTGEKTIQFVLK